MQRMGFQTRCAAIIILLDGLFCFPRKEYYYMDILKLESFSTGFTIATKISEMKVFIVWFFCLFFSLRPPLISVISEHL